MNIMARIISECVYSTNTFLLYHFLHDSCWITSDNGAIFAFIVPIVSIILVGLNFISIIMYVYVPNIML